MTLTAPVRPPLEYADDLAELAQLLRAWRPGSTTELDAARLTLKRVAEETSGWLHALLFLPDHETGPAVVMLIAQLETMAADIRRVMRTESAE